MSKLILSKQELIESRSIIKVEDKELYKIFKNKSLVSFESYLIDMEFMHNNNSIICKIKDEKDKVLAVGKANCSPFDDFDINIGMTIAEQRAKAKMYKKLSIKIINDIYDK